jgi:GNAT superfamily N-acetyltransferase
MGRGDGREAVALFLYFGGMMYPFVDLTLARRLERTEGMAGRRMVESRARISPERGSCAIEVAGTLAMFDGAESPLTQTFGLGMRELATADVLEALERFFAERGAPANHEVSPLAGVATGALLAERGYRPIELTSVMFRPIAAGAAAAAPAGPAVARPIVPGEEDLWSETAALGWSELAGAAAFMLGVGRMQAAADGYHLFLTEIAGQPVAAGALVVHEGVALLAGASTIPAARQRGAQLALLAARLQFAHARGCDLAMMCAEPGSGSQRNAERNGFRIAYTRTKWTLPLRVLGAGC